MNKIYPKTKKKDLERIELLAPAGNFERLQSALYFGADAVYMSGKSFGLRAYASNFEQDELANAINYTHSLNKRVYITANIFAKNADFPALGGYLEFLQEVGADACIVSDLGVATYLKKNFPSLPLHISTQANTTNKYAASAWHELGAERIILARELSLSEISEIRDFLPDTAELEVFVHGAMCVSYSGRCLLSNYLAGRDSNRGECVQACRWEYSLREKSREGEPLEIHEDSQGTYILNSKDLCLIEHLRELKNAGVSSFKIEGRMKTAYYVATVTNAYRRAIDLLGVDGEEAKTQIFSLNSELEKTSHRSFSTGFLLGGEDNINLKTSRTEQKYEFSCVVISAENGVATVEQRNRFRVGDTLEILAPHSSFNKTFRLERMTDIEGNEVLDAMRVQQRLKIICPLELRPNDILRKKIEN